MSVGSGSGAYSGSTFRDAVLNSTNLYRKQYQAEPLEWDNTLAKYAQRYAKQCIWEHSGGEYGENLAENYAEPALAIDAWANEETKYNYSKAKFGEKTGHFTQLVWRNTTRVGCGAVKCDNDADNGANGWYLVCEYDPPGNVIGSFKQNVLKSGGKDGEIGQDAGGKGDGQDAGGNGGGQEGAGAKLSGSGRLLVALVAVSSLAAMCL